MNKKIIIVYCLLVLVTSTATLANATKNLKKRLNKVKSFYAMFSQQVQDSHGSFIQDATGHMWVKRPNLFKLHMITPDESFLISNGKTLWVYNPLIEQVNILWLKDVATKTPFMLIANNQNYTWQDYKIDQKGNDFFLIPKSINNFFKKYTINIGSNGVINYFSSIEHDGQQITYTLHHQKNQYIDTNKFHFLPLKGMTIDDQR